jgi:hypothetical protein
LPQMKCFPFSSRKLAIATQVLENAKRSIDSLLPGFALQSRRCSWATARPAARIPARKVCGLSCREKHRHEKRDQPPVRFRKNLLGFRPENVRSVWFANSRPHAGLDHESVALEAGKVRSHRIISQVQLVREFVHGALSSRRSSRIFPRVLLNSRSRQPICFIDSKIMSIPSKSKDCLTNSSTDQMLGASLFERRG